MRAAEVALDAAMFHIQLTAGQIATREQPRKDQGVDLDDPYVL